MKKIFLALASLIMISAISFASNSNAEGKENIRTLSIEGQVLDLSTGEVLAGVKVVIEQTNDISYTDFEGNFTFEGLYPGSYKLSTSYISYKASDVEVNLNNEVTVKLKMEQLTR